MSLKQATISCIILLLYLFFGGAIFSYIEGENESEMREQLNDIYFSFNITGNCISDDQLQRIIQLTLKAQKYGIQELGNKTTAVLWDYFGSVFFCFVVVSTIGFGNMSPATTSGQLFCVFFAIFGIPIFMNCLYQLSHEAKKLIRNAERLLHVSLKKYHHIITAAAIIGMFLLIFILGAYIISYKEDWTFNQGLYFAFIALSTIGFGDYIAGTKPINSRWYKLSLLLWMLIGLTFVAVLTAYLQITIERTMKLIVSRKARRRIASEIFKKKTMIKIKTPNLKIRNRNFSTTRQSSISDSAKN